MKPEVIVLVVPLVVFVAQVEAIVQNKIQVRLIAPHTLIRLVVQFLVPIVKLAIIALILRRLKNVLLECILFLAPQLAHYVLLVIFVPDLLY